MTLLTRPALVTLLTNWLSFSKASKSSVGVKGFPRPSQTSLEGIHHLIRTQQSPTAFLPDALGPCHPACGGATQPCGLYRTPVLSTRHAVSSPMSESSLTWEKINTRILGRELYLQGGLGATGNSSTYRWSERREFTLTESDSMGCDSLAGVLCI